MKRQGNFSQQKLSYNNIQQKIKHFILQDIENILLVLDISLGDFDFSGDSYPIEDSIKKLMKQIKENK